VIFNLCSVVITTNNKTNGLFIPADDRRHDFMWSERTKEDPRFKDDYFTKMYTYFEAGGARDVTAFLLERDLRGFDEKAPPFRTEAFYVVVNANRPSEEGELRDVLDRLGNPQAVTLGQLAGAADAVDGGLADWLRDRANRRTIPHRLGECGYVQVRNPDAASGLWVVRSRREVVYASDSLSLSEQIAAARAVQ
jgi:hypothetical protein